MPNCSVTPKICLSLLTVIFWGCAAGLLYVGVSVYQEFNEYEAISKYLYTLLPATIIIALASFLFIIGLIGCIGAFKEHRCLLAVYCSVLMIILLTAITGSVLAYVYRDQVETGLMKGLDEALQHYGQNNSSVWTQEIDFMQQEMKCCGVNGSSDWLKTPWHAAHPDQSYPTSCCKEGNCTQTPGTNSTNIYTNGCYSYSRQQFMNNLGIVATSAAAFAVILMVGMVCSCLLACRRRNTTDIPYVGISSSDHMRV